MQVVVLWPLVVFTFHLTQLQLMSLGTGAIEVGIQCKAIQAQQGGNHGKPVSRNYPSKQLPTGAVTLKEIQWNTCHLPYLPTITSNGWGGNRTRIRKNSLKELSKGWVNLQRFAMAEWIGKRWSAVFTQNQVHVIHPSQIPAVPTLHSTLTSPKFVFTHIYPIQLFILLYSNPQFSVHENHWLFC